MKAIVHTKYGTPDVLQLQDVEKPIPKDDEVLIKIFATTVTPGDVRPRSFAVPLKFWLPARIQLGLLGPRRNILGCEFAGEIESVGKDVKLFKTGDRVFGEPRLMTWGAHAEYTCMVEDGVLAIIPEKYDL